MSCSSVPSCSFIHTATQCLLQTLRVPIRLYKAVHAHLFTVNTQNQKSGKPVERPVAVKKNISGQNKIQSNKKNFPIKNLIADKASLIIHRKTSRNGKARFHWSKSISLLTITPTRSRWKRAEVMEIMIELSQRKKADRKLF